MFKNYILYSFRNLNKNKAFAGINILGLTLGLTINFIIVLYLVNELTYDKYHNDSKQIYRVHQEISFEAGGAMLGPKVNALLGPFLLETYPDIINQTRISDKHALKFKVGETGYNEDVYFADSSFFDVLTCKFILGNPHDALIQPFALVITEDAAIRIFGTDSPLGKTITTIDDKIYTVSAVIEKIPENSHFKFNFLSSFTSLYSLDDYSDKIDGWGANYNFFTTYIKVTKECDLSILKKELQRVVEKFLSDNPTYKFRLSLEPLERIYLFHDGGGNITRIILFCVIGILLLIIPCINYMNLNIAEAFKRIKEVGVRKVAGATRKQLIMQFMVESLVISIISLLLAMALASYLLPSFNFILNKNLTFNYIDQWYLCVTFAFIALTVSVIAGIYPAFYLSSLKSNQALKSKFVRGSNHANFRNIFIVVQFAISIFLICCTGVILLQIKYSNNADLGFKKDNLVAIQLPFMGNSDSKILVEHLSRIPDITGISTSLGVPFVFNMYGHFYFDEDHGRVLALQYFTDDKYIDLFGLEVIKGREFNAINANERNNVIINETLAKQLGWNEPLGITFTDVGGKTEFTIIGVVKDFHTLSFHHRIHPLMLVYTNESKFLSNIVCELNPTNFSNTLEKMHSIVESIYPELDLEIEFIDKNVELDYIDERRTGYMFMYFAMVAIFITLIGLYGLALLISRQRTKELGIRIALGANTKEIVKALTLQFLKTIIVAIVIATPLAIFYSSWWLQSFVYQISNKWIIYILASFVVVAIALVTILLQSLRVARANPINALRYE